MPPPSKNPHALICQTYSLREAAKLLGVSHQSVWRQVRRGQMAYLRFGTRYRIHKQTLVNILGHPIDEAVPDAVA